MKNVMDYAFYWSSEGEPNSVYTTDLSTAKVCKPNDATLHSVTQMHHQWHHVFLVRCETQDGKQYIETYESIAKARCRTQQLSDSLRKTMLALKKSCNVLHVKAYGWVATADFIGSMEAIRQIGWADTKWKESKCVDMRGRKI